MENTSTDYDEFVKKFEPKKTTDDCYTPTAVYDVVMNYVSEKVLLDGINVLRPFYPGGDYEAVDYKSGDVVIDNPPFSIVSQIARFYLSRGIKFFIFAPHMTLFSSDMDCAHVVCGANVIYENGANVKTSFLTNMFENVKVVGAPDLYRALENINKSKVELPKYVYPEHVLTVSGVQKLVERGIPFAVGSEHVKHVRHLDHQKADKKAIFGSGFLLSDKAAADKAAADKAAADKAAADKAAAETVNRTAWQLSDRERDIVAGLGTNIK